MRNHSGPSRYRAAFPLLLGVASFALTFAVRAQNDPMSGMPGMTGATPTSTATTTATSTPQAGQTPSACTIATPTPTSTATPGVTQVTVVIEPGAFSRTTDAFGTNPLVVTKGTTVTWINCDTAPHTVTSTTPAGILNSGTIPPGGSYTYTFDDEPPGTYNYYCEIHPRMSGAVQVK